MNEEVVSHILGAGVTTGLSVIVFGVLLDLVVDDHRWAVWGGIIGCMVLMGTAFLTLSVLL